MEEIKSTQVETPKPAKRQRRPVGLTNRLDVLKQDPNRVYRIINDDPSRLAQFEAAGYRVEDVSAHMQG